LAYAVVIRTGGDIQTVDARLADDRSFEDSNPSEADANLLDAAGAGAGVDLMVRLVRQTHRDQHDGAERRRIGVSRRKVNCLLSAGLPVEGSTNG